MFTGQGSISELGLWDKLMQSSKAQEIFRMADEISGSYLSKLIAEGPLEELIETKNAQPAIAAFDLAALAVTKEFHPEIEEHLVAVAGHSAGEIPALAASGVVTLDQAIHLALERGRLMQQYGGRGKMAAIFADGDTVRKICEETGVEAVNFNGPRQTVVSGEAEIVDNVISLARAQRISGRPLNVPFAFHHSILMRTAQEEFAKVLASVEFRDTKMPVILNRTGQPETSGIKIKEQVAEQIASPVQWHKSMLYLLEQEINTFVEFGPQPVLTGLLKTINIEAIGIWVGDFASAKSLSF